MCQAIQIHPFGCKAFKVKFCHGLLDKRKIDAAFSWSPICCMDVCDSGYALNAHTNAYETWKDVWALAAERGVAL